MKLIYPLLFCWFLSDGIQAQSSYFMTVNGKMPVQDLKKALAHEHIVTNFAGAAAFLPPDTNTANALNRIVPAIRDMGAAGFNLMVECTPSFIGKDLRLLQQISKATGVHIITNTGLYAAGDRKYLPNYVFEESAKQLAARWIRDFKEGMEGTGIRPGFIKLGVGTGRLDSTEAKLFRAALICSKETGLPIAVHSGDYAASADEYDLLAGSGIAPDKLIWVHSQNGNNEERKALAEKGVWISLDNVNEQKLNEFVDAVLYLKQHHLLHRLLLSHDDGFAVLDNGSYQKLELFGNGNSSAYRTIPNKLIPLLTAKGVTATELDLLMRVNIVNCFGLK